MLETESVKMTRQRRSKNKRYLYKTGSSNTSSSRAHSHSHRLIQPNKSEVGILVRKTKFSTTLNTNKVSTNKCDVDRRPEIAMWPSKPEVFVKDSTTDITRIPMAYLGFSTTASSQKVSTSDYNVERQPKVATPIWPPVREIVIPLELQQIASKFQRQVRNIRPCRAE